MNTKKSIFIYSIVAVSFFVLAHIVFFMLQQAWFYRVSVGFIEHLDPVYTDYLSTYIAKSKGYNFNAWDTFLYEKIAKEGYIYKQYYAFFPLYPWIIKLFGSNMIMQAYLNFILYCTSLFLILSTNKRFQFNFINVVVLFSAPYLAVFFIPYSEAVFFFLFALGWYLKSKNHNIYVYGLFFLLAGMVRTGNVFLVFALCSALTYIWYIHKDKLRNLIQDFDWVFFLGCGILVAGICQFALGADSVFSFLDAQKYWGRSFSIPTIFTCWSDESFSLNCFLFVAIFPLFLYVLNPIRKKMQLEYSQESSVDFAILVYFISLTFLVYVSQKGVLTGLFRYIGCTPLFFIFLKKDRFDMRLFFTLSFLSFVIFNSHEKVHGVIQLRVFGFFLSILYFFFLSFSLKPKEKYKKTIQYIGIGILFIANLFFMSNIMYKYLAASWIIF